MASVTAGDGTSLETATLVISEVFSPTVQGEGPSLGRLAGFIRLMGCTLHCAWCDSAYTWNASRHDLHAEAHRMTVGEVTGRALAGDPGLVVITGGEPLLHQYQPGWHVLLDTLRDADVEIEVETSGTVFPLPESLLAVTRWNISPKLTHAGDPEAKRIRLPVLEAFRDTHAAAFKFVCRTPADVDEAAGIASAARIPPDMVWIMPEGTSASVLDTRLRALAGTVISHGFNLTTRLHVYLWGDERGH